MPKTETSALAGGKGRPGVGSDSLANCYLSSTEKIPLAGLHEPFLPRASLWNTVFTRVCDTRLICGGIGQGACGPPPGKKRLAHFILPGLLLPSRDRALRISLWCNTTFCGGRLCL